MLAPLFLLLVAGAPALGVLPFLALFILLAGLLYGTMYASFLHSCRLGIGFLPKCAPATVLGTRSPWLLDLEALGSVNPWILGPEALGFWIPRPLDP